MELFNRAVTAAICLLGGLAIGVFGLAALLSRAPQRTELITATDSNRTGISRHELSRSAGNAIALRTLELSSAHKRIAELQQQVDSQNSALGDARRELQHLAAQNERLRQERNQSLDWLLSLFSDDPKPLDSAADLTEPGAENSAVDMQAEQWQQLLEIEDLRSELELVRAALAEVQAARQIERVQADAVREQVERSAAELLARVGEEALVALSDALEHPDADVRRLAARSLRAFDGHGQAAIPALTMALADPDLRVREEAARALRAISD